VGAIVVRRTVLGKMSAAVFALGISAFLLGFLEPFFFPLAWASVVMGGLLAAFIWGRNRRASHPTVSHLAEEPDESKPIQPR
jgi:hypothetical protein